MRSHRRRVRRRRTRVTNTGWIVRSLGFLALVTICAFGVRWLGDGAHFYAVKDANSNGPSLSSLGRLQPQFIEPRNRRIVYPYSVVPGGVRSAEELRTAAEDDPLIAAHYTGFNYQTARVVEVRQPQLVYLSYRKDGHIYWSRKQASLHVGEKLLTDGHITARTRCGNQVSVLPESNTSPHEPTIAELDTPDALASGTELLFPSEVAPRLLEAGANPGSPMNSMPGNAFAGGPPPGGFMPIPTGAGGIGTPIAGNCPSGKTTALKNCNHNPSPPPPPPPPPPPVVPEPGTLVLMFSGVTALAARYRFFKK